MPAEQKGSTYYTAKGAGVRWIENGRRHKQSGFRSKTEARQWWNAEVAPRLRRGMSTSDITLREHVDRYLRVHPCSDARRRVLRSQLGAGGTPPKGSVLDVFGDRMLRDIEGASGEIAEWAATLPASTRRAKVGAFKQVLAAAVDWNRMLRNP